MSHEPPVPQGSVPPYPSRASEAADGAGGKLELAKKARANLGATPGTGWGRVAAGSAVGCAAVAAALLYWNRSHKA